MSQLKHYDNLGTARFITFSCAHRWKLLTNPVTISIVLDEINAARRKFDLAVFAYVIMPNHVHLVIYPRSPVEMGKVIGEIKSLSAKRIFASWREQDNSMLTRLRSPRKDKSKRAFWLAKCFDHNCRTIETIKEKLVYCHNNPVKAGLVANAGEWKWSSYKWYHGDRSGQLAIDDFEM